MKAGAEVRDGKQAWRQLRTDPDYVADWRAHGTEPVVEAAPFPFRRQTAADLEAARWNLLAWEEPRLAARASPFWADVPMIEARVMNRAKNGEDALHHIVRKSGATFTGLRLRDGTLVLKVQSRIVTTAHGINRGAIPDLSRPEGDSDFYFVPAEDPETAAARIVELVKTRIPKRFGFDAMQDIQVLCPMNRGGAGARSLNIELQAALNPAGERKVERFGWTFAPGDKVMQIENDYDKEVYNGDIGLVADVDPDAGELTARFEGRDLLYGFGELDTLVPAYAATVHKSQGSEYPAVVIPVLTQHYAMLRRNLLYTGVTRGKRLVVLVGEKKAVAIAVRNASGRRRWSKLDEWLAGGEDGRGHGIAQGARSPQGCQRRRKNVLARRRKNAPRASTAACPGSPREGPARGATRPVRGWRWPARGRDLWAHGGKRGVIRTVAGVAIGFA